MKHKLLVPSLVKMRGTLAAVALAAACSTSWALPAFTLDPAAVLLAGGPVIADNFIVSDYSTTTFTGPTTFLENGFLSIQSLQLGSGLAVAPGLNTTYGLYIDFTATGTISSTTSPSTGTFDTLSYKLFGYNGPPAVFGVSGTATTITTGPTKLLGTGSLIEGDVSTSSHGVPAANATVTFAPEPASLAFFAFPIPFYAKAETSFTNTLSSVTTFSTGFRITQGGGSFNFATPVPEPETYAMLLAGLAAVGFVASRRKR